MTESKSPRRDDDAPESEPDVYELNLDDEDAPAPASPPARRPAPSPGKPVGPDAAVDQDSGYDLAEPEPTPRQSNTAGPAPALDPRLDRSAVPPPAATGGGAAAGAAQGGDKPMPKLYQTEPEPAYLDPAVAASKREQARIRAAEQMAIEEEKRRKTRMIVLAVVVALAVVVVGWMVLF